MTSRSAAPTVSLRRLAPRDGDREDLLAFLTSNTFPFHVAGRRRREEVAAAIDDGAYENDETQTFWLEHAELGRIGLLRLEDLQDPTPLLDLRLAEAFRGRGLGADALRAATRHVFEGFAEVTRFEGQTREDNLAMRRTFLRCGWVKEAHYRESWPVEGGTPLASVAYAILRRDWESGTTAPVPWEESALPADRASASLDLKIQQYYSGGAEAVRLTTRSAGGQVEATRIRTELSSLPAGSRILDVGGGTGVHAAWLAERGHDVTLLDPVPEQVEIAARVGTFTAEVGDARALAREDASFDAVLMFGPLYHLASPAHRLTALTEAHRVLRPGGLLLVSAISRVNNFLDGVLGHGGTDTTDEEVAVLRGGDWTNPGEGFPGGHFHTAAELHEELAAAGFPDARVRGLEMPSIAWELYPADDILRDLCTAVLERMDALDPDGSRAALIADLTPHLLASALRT